MGKIEPNVTTLKALKIKPEKETENREGADVSSGSGHGRKVAADESGPNEQSSFPEAKVGNRFVRLPLVLSEMKGKHSSQVSLKKMVEL
jgi:hypothetical protein